MKLSIEWLNEFVDLKMPPVTAKEFSETMSLSGSKVETYKHEAEKIDNIVVAKILSIEKHPDADKLFVCQIDINTENNLQIVTAAKNIQVGDKVPVALHNSTLADGSKIKKGKLRGVESNGMFCSIAELGVTIDDFPEAIEDGIFILPEDAEVGIDIKKALSLDDVIFDFEITSNRADCFSIIGLSREVAATYGKELRLHEPVVKAGNGNIEDFLSVKIQDEDVCPNYCARVVKNVKIQPSPLWMRERLRRMGVRPKNNIVDITNYVMLEYGQPMHAFDLNFVKDGNIVVRKAYEGENLILLDDSELKLRKDDLIIADTEKPLALAGVMGGKYSGISDDTQVVVFESANFSAKSVRSASRYHGVRTDSSALFEKGLDANSCLEAINRACELIEMLNAGDVLDGVLQAGAEQKELKHISLDSDWINNFLNINISQKEMEKILEKLGFVVNGNDITVPSFRMDVEAKADIAEEIARFYGYNNIKTTKLQGSSQGGYSKLQKFKNKLSATMVSLGASEILTYSFISPKLYDKTLIDENSKLRNYVKILNPLGEDTSVMRTFALPSILEAISRNYNNRNTNACLFEIAKEYIKTPDSKLPDEINKLVLAMYGENADFFSAKGIAEEMLKTMCINSYKVSACNEVPYYHPGRCAKFAIDSNLLGYVAEVHPTVLKNFGVDEKVYSIYFDFELMYQHTASEKTFKPLPKFPSVSRDLAVVCDINRPVADLEKLILESSPKLLEEFSIFDVYTGEQIEKDKKSVAFKLMFRSDKETLTDKQIENIMSNIVKNLENTGAKLRLV